MPASFNLNRPISSEAAVWLPPRIGILFLLLLTVAITAAILIFFFFAGVIAAGCLVNLSSNHNPNSDTFKDPDSIGLWPENLWKLSSWLWSKAARITSSNCPVSEDGDPSRTLVSLLLLVAVGTITFVIVAFGVVAGICLLQLHRLYIIMPNPNPNADVFDDSNSFGLSSEDLRKLPSFEWSTAARMTSSECVVCMDGFGDGDRCRNLPACGHLFHGDCVDEWLMRSKACPICRRSVLPAAV